MYKIQRVFSATETNVYFQFSRRFSVLLSSSSHPPGLSSFPAVPLSGHGVGQEPTAASRGHAVGFTPDPAPRADCSLPRALWLQHLVLLLAGESPSAFGHAGATEAMPLASLLIGNVKIFR